MQHSLLLQCPHPGKEIWQNVQEFMKIFFMAEGECLLTSIIALCKMYMKNENYLAKSCKCRFRDENYLHSVFTGKNCR